MTQPDTFHDYMKALVPLSTGEAIWYVVTIAITITAAIFITRAYHLKQAIVWVIVVSLAISWIALQTILYVRYGDQTWLPGRHTAIFFWGDGVALPLIAVGFVILRRIAKLEQPYADRRSWLWIAAGLALLVTILFHWHEIATWELQRLHSFEKVYHDFVVYPLFLYFLGSQIPFLVETPLAVWRRRREYPPRCTTLHGFATAGATLLAFGGFFGWWWLGNVYDRLYPFKPLLGFA